MKRRIITRALRDTFIVTLSIWMVLIGLLSAVAHAQSTGVDFEAPIIEHEQIDSGQLGDAQVFSATVVDNEVVAGVTFFYRFTGNPDFIDQPMQLLPGSSLYTITVETAGITTTGIEYYIQAQDPSENVVLKGFAFDPLIRMIDDGAQEIATISPAADTKVEPKKKFNLLYIALGVLAIGAVAAAAGGGSDGGGGETSSCTTMCSVTVTVSPF